MRFAFAARERLIQIRRIVALTDLESDSEKAVSYAASLARWYGSELSLVHACGVAHAVPEEPAGERNPKQDAKEKLESLTKKLSLQDLAPKVIVREAAIRSMLAELSDYRPSLLVLASHGREGLRKYLST